MSKEAMKLALEALEKYCTPYQDGTHPADEAITALREAIAEQPAQGCDHCNHSLYAGTKCKNCGRVTEQAAIKRDLTPEQLAQQEPVATITITQRGPIRIIDNNFDDCVRGWPDGEYNLYTFPQPAQRTWVGLTDEDIEIAFDDTQEGGGFNEFARAIEQRLKEKNT